MSLIQIEEKISRLDYSLYNQSAGILDSLYHFYRSFKKSNDKYGIILVMRILSNWLDSINNKGLYSPLPTNDPRYLSEQLKYITMNKVRGALLDLIKRIQTENQIRLVPKNAK